MQQYINAIINDFNYPMLYYMCALYCEGIIIISQQPLWKLSVTIIPIVIGVLGSVPLDLVNCGSV